MAKPEHCPECGAVLEPKKARSTRQHNRQFAIFEATFFHWPETHVFRPKSKDHLRYWLVVQAGKFDVIKTVRVRMVDPDELAALLTAVLRTSKDDTLFVEADADLIVVKRAHSIAFDKLTHSDACDLFDAIAEVIKVETGVEAERMLKEMEAAA